MDYSHTIVTKKYMYHPDGRNSVKADHNVFPFYAARSSKVTE